MTKSEKEKRKNELIEECTKILMEGSTLELQEKIFNLCEKYFPNCDLVFKNFCFNYVQAMRLTNINLKAFNKCVNKYKQEN